MAKPIDKLNNLSCPYCTISGGDLKTRTKYGCHIVGEDETWAEEACSLDDMAKCKVAIKHSELLSVIAAENRDFMVSISEWQALSKRNKERQQC